MARVNPTNDPIEANVSIEEAIALADAANEWETVTEAAPTKIVFDTIGDRFIGMYVGTLDIPAEQNITKDKPEGEAFSLYLFRGGDSKNTLYAVNKSAKLELAMEQVDPGRLCRLTYVADVPTKRGQNPMKDITVDVAR